jgi:hypothetical protein
MTYVHPRAASPVQLIFVEGDGPAEIAEFADALFAHATEGLTALSRQLANRHSMNSPDDADLLSMAASVTALAARAVRIAEMASLEAYKRLEEELRTARAEGAPAS